MWDATSGKVVVQVQRFQSVIVRSFLLLITTHVPYSCQYHGIVYIEHISSKA